MTYVNGKPCAMAERDMILTPAWTWHEHEHRGAAPLVWLDVLDVPLHNALGTALFRQGPCVMCRRSWTTQRSARPTSCRTVRLV